MGNTPLGRTDKWFGNVHREPGDGNDHGIAADGPAEVNGGAPGSSILHDSVAGRGTNSLRRRLFFLEPVAKNDLGEPTQSTPALVGGRIIFRTEKSLIAIGGKK